MRRFHEKWLLVLWPFRSSVRLDIRTGQVRRLKNAALSGNPHDRAWVGRRRIQAGGPRRFAPTVHTSTLAFDSGSRSARRRRSPPLAVECIALCERREG